jgi:hypothetical protein
LVVRVESVVKASPSDSTLALCLRIICTGANASDKSRFPVTDTFMIFHDGLSP